MLNTNRIHALTAPDETSALPPFDTLMAASGLSVSTPPLNEQTVRTALREYFGLIGALTRIPTEKDDTFVLDGNQERLLVKVSGAQEAPDVVNLQTAVLRHLAEVAPALPIPTVRPGDDGRYEYDLARADAPAARVLRVMKFLPGSALSENRSTTAQLVAVGRAQAAMTRALAGFAHPRQDRTLVWDLRYFPTLRPLLDDVADADNRRLGTRIFDAYAEFLQDRVPRLRHQVVHGDFSAHNVLVDSRRPEYVSGIIDFGDSGRTAEIFDIAIAVSNQLDAAADDPWRRGLDLLTGYLTARAVDGDELALLPIAVAARSLQRALIAQWRAQHDPARADYVLSHAAHDWIALRAIGIEWSPVVDRIHSINDSASRE
ncbi:phosphotransferase [Nocardia sp. NPDC046473]|uniref:phosphotransferase n=1 Tax=Nocardia sp. NPDC046473 TaxID=3155733 RepID=UPI0033CE472E